MKENRRFLIFITFTATLGGLLFGYDTAVISGTITLVARQFTLTPGGEGWFVSSALVGCLIGVVASGAISERFGRKPTMIFATLLFMFSSLGSAYASNFDFLILSRIAGGLGIGVASMICPMYIAEIAPSAERGRLVTFYQLAITIGIVLAYGSNAVVISAADRNTTFNYGILLSEPWRGMFFLSAIPALFFVLFTALIPESPHWLILKGRLPEGQKVLERIGGAVDSAEEAARMAANSAKKSDTGTGLAGMLNSGILRRSLFIGVGLCVLSQLSGINAIIYYGPRILELAGLHMSQALGGQVIIGFVNILFTWVAIFLVDRWGRKPLLYLGISGCFLSLIAISFFFFQHVQGGVFLTLLILVFVGSFSFSFGPITWVVISEIFPTAYRSTALATATFALWAANVVVGQMFPTLLASVGPAFTFIVFAAFCLPAYLVTFLLPETKGISLQEI